MKVRISDVRQKLLSTQAQACASALNEAARQQGTFSQLLAGILDRDHVDPSSCKIDRDDEGFYIEVPE